MSQVRFVTHVSGPAQLQLAPRLGLGPARLTEESNPTPAEKFAKLSNGEAADAFLHAWCIGATSAKVAITRPRTQKISKFAWNTDVTPLPETSRLGLAMRRARISATRKCKRAHPHANISRNRNVAPPWRMVKS